MSDFPLTLTDAARALRSGSTTSVELTRRSVALADEIDEALGVYITRFDDCALERAAVADAELAHGLDRGPLHGLPVGVKDVLAMSEGPTSAQSLVLDPAWGKGKDAPVVERLKGAGAVLTGKLTTMEFACGMPDFEKPFPVPRNPWSSDTWPGGSSSGTGAAVAAGIVYAGVGTDTGGSIRIPAAFCGVTGLKPTFGRVPNAGCVPLGYSLDCIGPLARSARDCGAFLGAIAGPDPRDHTAAEKPVPDFLSGPLDGSLAELRIGVDRISPFKEGDDPGVAPALETAVATLESLGATIVDIELPYYQPTLAAMWTILASEALAYHRNDLQSRWHDFSATTRMTIAAGVAYSGADYVQAQRVRRVSQRAVAALFTELDLVVTPTATMAAPTHAELLEGGLGNLTDRTHTLYWSALGNPALAMPMGFNGDHMPLSVHVAARPFEEALLIRAGDAYQRATDWHTRVPPSLADPVIAR
jgi:aspartyl-tRNA(Asn)/glutamyl-tRNA(Gln) amidotransferase subunit A